MTTTICKQFELEAAHQLPHHDGKCAHLHGHTYKFEVFVIGKPRHVDALHPHPQEGMVLDFKYVSKIFKEKVFSRIDHTFLNESIGDEVGVTTAENLAYWCYTQIEQEIYELSGFRARAAAVRVWETSSGYAEFRCDD